MKVALTGAGGMLGAAVKDELSDMDVFPFTRKDFDITDLDHTVKAIRETKPDILIHAAAFTNVDQCESEPEKAYLVNGIGTRNVAIACDEVRCPVVYISSDYVFDGSKKSPYNEWDRTNPINTYGISKLMGEQFVSTMTNRFYIVRTSWLFGRHGGHFVDTMIKLLTEKDRVDVVNDQTGSPTFTRDLAKALGELIGKGYGIYHVTNSGTCSWYEFAVMIGKKKGLAAAVNPVSSAVFTRPAQRPVYSVLGKTMLRLEGISEPRHWEDALSEYLRDCEDS